MGQSQGKALETMMREDDDDDDELIKFLFPGQCTKKSDTDQKQL